MTKRAATSEDEHTAAKKARTKGKTKAAPPTKKPAVSSGQRTAGTASRAASTHSSGTSGTSTAARATQPVALSSGTRSRKVTCRTEEEELAELEREGIVSIDDETAGRASGDDDREGTIDADGTGAEEEEESSEAELGTC